MGLFTTNQAKPAIVPVASPSDKGKMDEVVWIDPAIIAKLNAVGGVHIVDDSSLMDAKTEQMNDIIASEQEATFDSLDVDVDMDTEQFDEELELLKDMSPYGAEPPDPEDVSDDDTEDKCVSKYKIKYSTDPKDIKKTDPFKVDIPCELIKATDKLANRMKLEEFAKSVDGLYNCPYMEYDAAGPYNALLKATAAMSLLKTSIKFEDADLMRAMNCVKSMMDTAQRGAKLYDASKKFASKGSIGMLKATSEALGADKLYKPDKLVKMAGVKTSTFTDGEWDDMVDVLDDVNLPKSTIIKDKVHGISDSIYDQGSIVAVIKNDSAKHYTDELSSEDMKMMKHCAEVVPF